MPERIIPAVIPSDSVSSNIQPESGYIEKSSAINDGESLITANDQINIAFDASIQEIAIKFVVLAFIVSAVISAFFIFFGGLSFILSGGNEEKIKKAINTIRYSIIGLIVTILSGVFVTVIGRFFGFHLEKFIPSIDQIQIYINQIVGSSSEINEKTDDSVS